VGEQAALFEDFAEGRVTAPVVSPLTDEAGAEKDGAASGPPETSKPESGAAPSSDLSDLTDAIEAALACERMALTCCAEGEEHARLRWSALYHWRGAEMHWLESLQNAIGWWVR
jgi:hypothetical protein